VTVSVMVPGPPGVRLQTLLLKHNRRVKQGSKNSLPLNYTIGELGHRKASSTELLLCCVVCVKLSSVGDTGELWCHPPWFWRHVFQ